MLDISLYSKREGRGDSKTRRKIKTLCLRVFVSFALENYFCL